MLLELDDLGSDDLYQGEKGSKGQKDETPAGQGLGQPVQLPLDLVDEDPNQPRREFDEEALQELAQTIALRGVRQPVSVRPHPEVPGRWMLNFGARRYRASQLAGKAEIPAFVDETADTYDQVIENEQRQGLKPLELATFIGARMKLGESQTEIARLLGKSKSVVSYACALIGPPDCVMAVYRSGVCTGYRELYELRRLHAQSPQQVEAWLQGRDSITRADLHELSTELASTPVAGVHAQLAASSISAPAIEGAHLNPAHRPEVREQDAVKSGQALVPMEAPSCRGVQQLRSGDTGSVQPVAAPAPSFGNRLWVRQGGEVLELMLDAVPEDRALLFVRYPGGLSRPAPVSSLMLVGFGQSASEFQG